jgi:hypothetical protein
MMKKIILIVFTAVMFSFNIFAQTESFDLVYNGPKNTQELTTVLYNSENPLLIELSQNLKQSLINHMVFDGVRFRGMVSWDDNIEGLMSSPAFLQVFSVILNCKCIANSTPVKRDYDVIVINGSGLLGVCSMCTACPPFSGQGPHGCCNVSKGMCCDLINPLLLSSIQY